jgi:hypothetical protein
MCEAKKDTGAGTKINKNTYEQYIQNVMDDKNMMECGVGVGKWNTVCNIYSHAFQSRKIKTFRPFLFQLLFVRFYVQYVCVRLRVSVCMIGTNTYMHMHTGRITTLHELNIRQIKRTVDSNISTKMQENEERAKKA